MRGRKRCDEILQLIDGAVDEPGTPERPGTMLVQWGTSASSVQWGTGASLLPTSPALSPVAHPRFHPSLQTASEQMAERSGQEGVRRGA